MENTTVAPKTSEKLYNLIVTVSEATPDFGANGPFFRMEAVRVSNGKPIKLQAFNKAYDIIKTAMENGSFEIGKPIKFYGAYRTNSLFRVVTIAPEKMPVSDVAADMVAA